MAGSAGRALDGEVWTALVEDGRADAGPDPVEPRVPEEPWAPLVAAVRVLDTQVPVARAVLAPARTPVSLVLTGGAGQVAGPVSAATSRGLAVVAVGTTLRDPADLAGAARRVATAVDAARASGELDEETPVHVGIPGAAGSGAGWSAALDVLAEAGLAVDVDPADLDAAALDALLDRELTLRARVPGGLAALGLLAAVRACLAGDPARADLLLRACRPGATGPGGNAERGLGGAAGEGLAALVRDARQAYDDQVLARTRRWVVPVVPDPAAAWAELVEAGLLPT